MGRPKETREKAVVNIRIYPSSRKKLQKEKEQSGKDIARIISELVEML